MTEPLEYASPPVRLKTMPGVIYDDRDMIGVFRRVLIDLVDGAIVLSLSFAIYIAGRLIDPFGPLGEFRTILVLGGLTTLWFGYLVLLKRSDVGTLGYRLTNARIVNLRGQRPGLGALTLRLVFATFGPLNIVADLLWIGSDARKQALRDKVTGTYVIRRGALPARQGEIGYAYLTLVGTNFIFAEVKDAEGPTTTIGGNEANSCPAVPPGGAR